MGERPQEAHHLSVNTWNRYLLMFQLNLAPGKKHRYNNLNFMRQTMPDVFCVCHVLSLSSSPLVVSGDLSEKGQGGFPITHVGNDRDGDGYSIHVILVPSASSGQGLEKSSLDSEAFRPGHRFFAVGSG